MVIRSVTIEFQKVLNASTWSPKRRYPAWANAKNTTKNIRLNPQISLAHCGKKPRSYPPPVHRHRSLTFANVLPSCPRILEKLKNLNSFIQMRKTNAPATLLKVRPR